MTDSDELASWQVQALERAVQARGMTVIGIIQRVEEPPKRAGPFKRLWANRDKFLWRLFNRYYVSRYSLAVRPRRFDHLVGKADIIRETPIRSGRFGEIITADTLQAVRVLNPDVILRFGFGIIKGEILEAALHGVWSFHHGDPREFRGQPPGFWEIYHGKPSTGAILQLLSAKLDAGRILQRGAFRTIGHSYVKTRDAIYFGGSSWLLNTCRAIQLTGQLPSHGDDDEPKGKVFYEPKNRQMIVFLAKTFVNFLRMIRDYHLMRQAWTFGVVPAPIEVTAGLEGRARQIEALSKTHWFTLNSREFNADPFAMMGPPGEKFSILFESFEWNKGRGEIHAVEYDGTAFTNRRVILDGPTHLSYPFVFDDGRDRVFLPENSEGRDVSAFELNEQSTAARRLALFPDTDLVDTSIVEWEGRLWAFASIDRDASNAELHIFYADRLAGPWSPHALNPVKIDVRNARPGGTPFIHNGQLYRPAQDCGPNYGAAVIVNRIEALTPTEFREVAVGNVHPVEGSDLRYGLHTLSAAGDWTLIDGSKRQFRL